ncbi:mucin-binding protein, partial [Limosilactobacillus reuteri]|uniref:mucin-binding protein n=1 Tax=Limosilactobacillus reuteri TaxID=1598 RepID=UPI0017823600|nr:peptidase [Limosilactobacillus reuteri]
PSQREVPATKVTSDTKDQTVTVTYTANDQTTTINYVDERGKVIHTTVVNGHTDQTVKVPTETPAGWTITKGQVPTEITFGPNGHADVTVTVGHQHVTVTSDQPKTSVDKLPDNPAKTYPNGVGHDDLNKTITRIVKVTTPAGQTKTVTQTAKLTRTADVDEVTGEVTYGQWTTAEWSSYDVPAVPGY